MENIESVFSKIDTNEAIALLQELVQVNSVNPPGNEKEVAEVIQAFLASTNLEVELDDLGENRANLFVTYPHSTPGSKFLSYSGHFDTVPTGQVKWEHDPFSGKQIGNKIYGRGTTDMKSGVAAMVLALKYLADAGVTLNGKLQFVGTAGEEVDGYGAKQVMKKEQINGVTAMVVSEPSQNELFTAHKGALWLEVTAFGKTAHGSMPDQGVNAINVINDFLNELKAYEFTYTPHDLLGHPTLNIGTIQGGVQTNVVPDQCSVTLDIRTVPGQDNDEIVRAIQAYIKKVAENAGATYSLKEINNMASVATNPEDPFIQLAIQTGQTHLNQQLTPKGVNYYTDASVYWPQLQIPTFIYGPGNQKLAHQPNETVEIDKFIESIRYFMALAIDYLKE